MKKITVDQNLIRTLSRLLDETGLDEIELGDGDHHVRVARGPRGAPPATIAPAPIAAVEPTAEAAADTAHPDAITSPMVGTVYVAPEPSAAPFVRAGDSVAEGQTLMIIEAMKVMNPIRAPRGGKVTRILVENGDPVEFGEALLILE